MTPEKTSSQSEIIPRLYMKLLPVQIILENWIDISVRSMDEVINLSERVWNFCEKHGISEHVRSEYPYNIVV